jgi:hypothetical protein
MSRSRECGRFVLLRLGGLLREVLEEIPNQIAHEPWQGLQKHRDWRTAIEENILSSDLQGGGG